MRYSIILIAIVLSGCSTIPTDFIKTAAAVQEDNDKYWANIVQSSVDEPEAEVVEPTEIITESPVRVETNTRTYKLEVYPLGP